MAGCPGKGQEAKPALDHQELVRAILLFKASKGEALIQYDEQGAYVVWHEETDLCKYGDDDQRRTLIKFLLEDFNQCVTNIETGLSIKMTRKCAKKIGFYRTSNQRNIAVYCKELMTIANFAKAIPYTKTKRFDVEQVLLFNSRIRIGASMFSVQLNVFNSKISGYLLYDINKISQAGDTALEGPG